MEYILLLELTKITLFIKKMLTCIEYAKKKIK